ncbi:MAG: PAS domain S-box protein [Deltaproteobacteria bacterium]|nr:PAS domain S-box protein [Deltaproteobacteria bacterium]
MYTSITASVVYGEDGEISHFDSIMLDVTEQKRAEKELRESELWMRSIFDSLEEAVLVVTPDRKLRNVNDAAQRMFGYSPEELLNLSTEVLHVDHEHYLEFGRRIKEAFDKGKVANFEFESKKKNGEVFPTEHTVSLLKSDQRELLGIVSVIRDNTERKQAEENLKQVNQKLSKEHNQRKILSKRLIDLLEKDRHDIAMELHDHIGQTLTSLKLNLETIHAQLEPTESELGSHIKAAKEKAINALKDIKSISHGLKPSILDTLGLKPSLRELFNDIQRDMDIKIKFFSRNISKEIAPEKELAIYRITQEALTNVIKHARAKEVFVNLIKKEKNISLSIEDDGVGFNPDKTIKVMKRKGPLGLLIMQERAIQLDGEFTVESQIGQGTHVLVGIPL